LRAPRNVLTKVDAPDIFPLILIQELFATQNPIGLVEEADCSTPVVYFGEALIIDTKSPKAFSGNRIPRWEGNRAYYECVAGATVRQVGLFREARCTIYPA
jgi:hypothetical protein